VVVVTVAVLSYVDIVMAYVPNDWARAVYSTVYCRTGIVVDVSVVGTR
jgi:hypothetical protein